MDPNFNYKMEPETLSIKPFDVLTATCFLISTFVTFTTIAAIFILTLVMKWANHAMLRMEKQPSIFNLATETFEMGTFQEFLNSAMRLLNISPWLIIPILIFGFIRTVYFCTKNY